jgi:hypothetical protein
MSYQPSQNLSWLYVNATGQLSIIATVSVTDLTPTERLYPSAGPISGGKCDIQITVSGGTYNSPVPIPVPYVNIGAGLQTEPIVRGEIAKLSQVGVNTEVYKDGSKKGDVNKFSTKNDNIIIV